MFGAFRARAGGHVPAVAGLLAIFAGSRILLRSAGVEFDTAPLSFFWQYIDIRLLRHDLLRSLWNLHSQPPLYNLFLGINLKLFSNRVGTALHFEYLAMGVALMCLVYVLLWRVTGRRAIAFALAAFVAVNPSVLLFENWLFYEYPVVVLLLAALVAFEAFTRRRSAFAGFAFFTCLALLVYTRSTFQLIWFVLAGLVAVWAAPGARRLVLGCAAVPFVAVILLYVKNEVLFGVPATSSWAGMNLAQVAFKDISESELQRLVSEGKLAKIAATPPFSTLDHYPGAVAQTRHTGVPVLDEHLKALHVSAENTVSGTYNYSNNYNNLAYVKLSNEYLRATLHLIWLRPGVYLHGVADGIGLFVRPASSDGGVHKNEVRINRWTQVYDTVLLLRVRSISATAWAIVLAYLMAISYGVVLLRRAKRGPPAPGDPLAVLLVAWVTLVYLTVVISLGEVAENQRLRFCLDPLVLMLDAVAFRELLRRRRVQAPRNQENA